jgi:hypothetical protein
MMLIKALVFRGDDSMPEIGRDSVERNEFIAFVIRRVVNPGLQAALRVHRGGRRVDPSGSHKDQRRKRPKKRRPDEKPSNEGSEPAFPRRDLRGSVLVFSHVSE